MKNKRKCYNNQTIRKGEVPVRAVIFDFDGVMVDSFDAAYDANRIVFPGMTKEEYRRCFCGNINETMAGIERKRKLARSTAADFFALYGPRSAALEPLPAVADAITALGESYDLFIISSSLTEHIVAILRKRGLDKNFREILGNDIHTSKVEKFRSIFDRYRLVPGDCVFVTDTLGDLIEAEKVGVECLAVTWGFHDQATLSQGRYRRILIAPEELLPAIHQHFPASATKLAHPH